MRKLGIDYGDSRVGIAITDPLGITVQGLETIDYRGNDKILLRRLDENFNEYEVDTIVVGMSYNMNGKNTLVCVLSATLEMLNGLRKFWHTDTYQMARLMVLVLLLMNQH